ncbi:hypothetical protein ACSLVQ_28290, partial [Klebsiella pneumoniae]|uniref:hypothetical protein n=1 Tax=Klebsiella pneumoniae TaxID=573 RepID=UPI003EE2532E
EKLSKWGAGKVISNIKQREKHGLATPQQVHEMMACGISPTIARGVTKEEAVEILSRKGDQKGFDFGDSRGSDQGVPRKPRTQKGVQR